MSDQGKIEKGLLLTSSIPERIEALREIGFSLVTISNVIGVSSSSMQHWIAEKKGARIEHREKIDDLRAAAAGLAFKGYNSEETLHIMESRSEVSPFERPIEIIKDRPLEVLDYIGSLPPAQPKSN